MSQKILILGGTGAMGVYLVPELLHMGYQVHVISLDEKNQIIRTLSIQRQMLWMTASFTICFKMAMMQL